MRIKPEIGSVVGPANDTHWGQVLILPNAYGVVEIEDPNGRARELGIGILSTIADFLTQSPTTLAGVGDIVKKSTEVGVVTLLLLVPVGMTVYIVLFGSAAVYIKRENEFSCLMDKPGAISGELKLDDTLLLISQAFTQVLSEQELTGVFDHLGAKDAAEKLTLLLHEAMGGDGSAGLVYKAMQEIPVEEEQLPINATTIAKTRPFKTIFAAKQLLKKVARTSLFSSRRNKLAFFAAIIFFSLFIVSVILGITKEGFGRNSGQVTQKLLDAQHAFDEGVALMELNPVKGRERLRQAKTIVEPLTKIASTRSKEGREIASLYKQVIDNLTQAMHTVKAEPGLFYDVSLVKKSGQASSISLEDNTLAIADKELKTIYTVGVATKNGKIAAGGASFNESQFITIHGPVLFVLTNGGIVQIDTNELKIASTVIKKDDTWGTIGALVSFGGNLYLLDTTKSRIWKYIATENGFSDRREYLNPDTLPDLSRATGMAIDGSIFLGTTDGKILRFTQGKENTFIPQGVDPPLGNDLLVYTNDEIKNIYILDRGGKRVVVLDKDGIYLAQYIWDGSFVPTQYVVSEKSGKIFLLAEGKIYSLDLK